VTPRVDRAPPRPPRTETFAPRTVPAAGPLPLRAVAARWTVVLALLAVLAVVVAYVSPGGAPSTVWTPRAPARSGEPTAVVRDEPGGAPIAGRWVVVEGFEGTAAISLVRVTRSAAAAGDFVYEPTGRTRSTAGGPWYEWRRRGP
jgi:hypothetical protein